MANDILNALLKEKIDVFKSAFSVVSTEVFYDPVNKRLRHAGEYGMFRESIVRDFLKFIVPKSLDMSTGFIITSMNDVSTQCDVVIYDPRITPLYQEGDRQRFFPIESVYCVGEVKSTMSKQEFKEAINKLARVKALSERIKVPIILKRLNAGDFDPVINPMDCISTILICQKLDFDLSKIESSMDSLYESDILHRHKHNIIFSIEDGIILYYEENEKFNLAYPILGKAQLKHRFIWSKDPYSYARMFSTLMFAITAHKTLLYPEITEYIGNFTSIENRDQG